MIAQLRMSQDEYIGACQVNKQQAKRLAMRLNNTVYHSVLCSRVSIHQRWALQTQLSKGNAKSYNKVEVVIHQQHAHHRPRQMHTS